jgi:hypothetical protein
VAGKGEKERIGVPEKPGKGKKERIGVPKSPG